MGGLPGACHHLTDPAQNATFKDRYFAGVPLDLSRCIVVFSYNAASDIDAVLLDRVHRIRIDPMSLRAKCDVAQRFLLPAICRDVGVDEHRNLVPRAVVRHIAARYTREAGVRRLKELHRMRAVKRCAREHARASTQRVSELLSENAALKAAQASRDIRAVAPERRRALDASASIPTQPTARANRRAGRRSSSIGRYELIMRERQGLDRGRKSRNKGVCW